MTRNGTDTGNYELDLALARLQADGYGSNWTIVGKRKTLSKFGRRTTMVSGAKETIWESPAANETYLSPADGNLIDTVSSTSTADVGDVIPIEGHYWDDNDNLIFATESIVTNGRNKVSLSRGYCRVNRGGHDDDTPQVGDLSFYEDTAITNGLPTDTSKIHLTIKGTLGENQSYKAASSISYLDAFIITQVVVGVQRSNAGAIDCWNERRNAKENKLFLPFFGRFPVNSTGSSVFGEKLDPPLTVAPNSDFRFRGIASANGITGNATISGYLATRPDPL